MATEMATQMAPQVATDSASHVATDLASQMIAVLATEMTTARHDSLCSSGRGARPFGTWRDGGHGREEGFLSNLDALRVAQAGGSALAFVGKRPDLGSVCAEHWSPLLAALPGTRSLATRVVPCPPRLAASRRCRRA